MSALMNFFRDWRLPNPRKRRIDPSEEGIPKLRRIGNFWNIRSRFSSRSNIVADIEKDHFLEVKQKRSNYNGILESFLMEERQKQMQTFNDLVNENDENISQITNSSNPGPSNQPKLSNRFESSSFHHSQHSSMRSGGSKPIPSLVPLTSTPQSNFTSSIDRGTNRSRPIPDLVSRNRAFGNMSSEFHTRRSIMDYNNGLDSMKKYDNLLKSVVPGLYNNSSSQHQQQSGFSVRTSYKDTAESFSPPGVYRPNGGYLSSPSDGFGARKSEAASKPTCTIEISEDEEDSEISFRNCNTSSAINKEEKSSISSATTLTASMMVKPVNTLLERTQRKPCWKDTAIKDISRKYMESRKKAEQEINDMNRTITELSLETANEEKLQQKRIDRSISSILQTIVLDEDDEIVNEFPPLTIEQRQMVDYAWRGGSKNDMLAQKFNLNITRADLQTLSGLNWLNDEVINYYMEMIKERGSEEEHLPNTHVMNTFFIPKLMQAGHAGVRRWTRKVDIFAYDLIMVPVHVGNVHWCMAIMNLRDKWIRYYDSMGSPNPQVLEALQRYLEEESMDKRKQSFDTSSWTIESVRDCPRQHNGSDCGVFSCMFAEFTSRDSKISFDQSKMQYFREKMVWEIMTGRLML